MLSFDYKIDFDVDLLLYAQRVLLVLLFSINEPVM